MPDVDTNRLRQIVELQDLAAERRRECDTLAARLAEIHGWAEEIAEHFGDQWPHHGGCMGDPADSGCPLCRILAATAAE